MAHQPLAKILENCRRPLKLNKEAARSSLELLFTRRGKLSGTKRKVLEALLSRSAVLEEAYNQKELFLHLLTCQSKETVLPRYHEWSANLPTSVKPEFDSLVGGFRGWEHEIFDRFDLNFKNYLIGTENLIRALEKQSHTYSVDTIRGRVLYGDGVRILDQLPPPTEVEKYISYEVATPSRVRYPDFYEDLGSSIDKLIAYFEKPIGFTTNHD